MEKAEVRELNLQKLFPFQLLDIRLFEASIKRCKPDEDHTKETPISIALHQGNEPIDADEFGLLLSFNSGFPQDENPVCLIDISIEGRFRSIVDPSSFKPEVIKKFKDTDAIVLFWPYLRQFLHELTDKLRLGIPPLPVIDPRAFIAPEFSDLLQKQSSA
jgi:preprotein translocase subunit SecB